MHYSDKDADADCSDLLQDFENNFDAWLDVNQFHATVADTDPAVRTALNQHLESLRFVKYASAALMAEHNTLSRIMNMDHFQMSESLPLTDVGKQYLGQHDFFSRVPFEIDLHKVSTNSRTLSNAYDSNISMKQLTRDLERDRLVLNGRRLVGASEGIAGLIAAVGDTIDLTLAHCSLPQLSPTMRESVAVGVLRMACRTNSGGLSFHALRSVVGTFHIIYCRDANYIVDLGTKTCLLSYSHIMCLMY
jgi:hypothetical protein